MSIDKDLLDQLMEGRKPGDLFGKDGILQELTKALAERALSTELDAHLAEERADPPPEGATQPPNRRNGSSQKTVTTESGKVVLDIPRDRNGSFDPVLIAKYQRRFPEFDTKIISMYARGMTTREIQGHIEEIYGVEPNVAPFEDIRLSQPVQYLYPQLDRDNVISDPEASKSFALSDPIGQVAINDRQICGVVNSTFHRGILRSRLNTCRVNQSLNCFNVFGQRVRCRCECHTFSKRINVRQLCF